MKFQKINPIIIVFFFCTNGAFLYGQTFKDINYPIIIPDSTIAVDKALFPIGTVFFIPSAKGIEINLPDGQKIIHDGYFFSADIGGDIKGNHIDIFTGFSSSNPFPFITSKATGIFTAYRVNQKELVQRFQQMHRY